MYSEREVKLIRFYAKAELNLAVVQGKSRLNTKALICGNLGGAGFEDAAENTRLVDDVVYEHSEPIKR